MGSSLSVAIGRRCQAELQDQGQAQMIMHNSEMCDPDLEDGWNNAVYTYWKSTAGVWECYKGSWCKHACTALPFDLGNPRDDAVVDAAKVFCDLKGHRGLSHGERDIYFVPGEISASKWEEELEEGGNDTIYTYVSSGWHKVHELILTAEEPDLLLIEDAGMEISGSC